MNLTTVDNQRVMLWSI